MQWAPGFQRLWAATDAGGGLLVMQLSESLLLLQVIPLTQISVSNPNKIHWITKLDLGILTSVHH